MSFVELQNVYAEIIKLSKRMHDLDELIKTHTMDRQGTQHYILTVLVPLQIKRLEQMKAMQKLDNKVKSARINPRKLLGFKPSDVLTRNQVEQAHARLKDFHLSQQKHFQAIVDEMISSKAMDMDKYFQNSWDVNFHSLVLDLLNEAKDELLNKIQRG